MGEKSFDELHLHTCKQTDSQLLNVTYPTSITKHQTLIKIKYFSLQCWQLRQENYLEVKNLHDKSTILSIYTSRRIICINY